MIQNCSNLGFIEFQDEKCYSKFQNKKVLKEFHKFYDQIKYFPFIYFYFLFSFKIFLVFSIKSNSHFPNSLHFPKKNRPLLFESAPLLISICNSFLPSQ